MSAKDEQARLFPSQLKRIYKDMQTPLNQWEVNIAPTLPTICLDLRASLTGQSDPWSNKALGEVVDMLRGRVDEWDYSQADEMDLAVLRMVSEAMWMGQNELMDRKKRGAVYRDDRED